jgi:hypothetical protein
VFVIYGRNPVSLAIDSIVRIISTVAGFRSLVVTDAHIKLRNVEDGCDHFECADTGCCAVLVFQFMVRTGR